MPRGGARPGSGRKPTAEKYAPKVSLIVEKTANALEDSFENLRKLAMGEATMVKEVWQAAGTVVRKRGDQITHLIKGKKDHELVLVRREVVKMAPDREANAYLINRIMGKPADMDLDGILTEGDEETDFCKLTYPERLAFNLLKAKASGEHPQLPQKEGHVRNVALQDRKKMAEALLQGTSFRVEEAITVEPEEEEEEPTKEEPTAPKDEPKATEENHTGPTSPTGSTDPTNPTGPTETPVDPISPISPIRPISPATSQASSDRPITQDIEQTPDPRPKTPDPIKPQPFGNTRLLPASDAPPPNQKREPRYTEIIRAPSPAHTPGSHVFDPRYPSTYFTDEELSAETEWGSG